MAKKLVGKMKLQIKAGQANPSPPVGPALGQRGINIMEFCKAFNAKTADMEPGAPLPTVISLLPGQVLHDGHQDAAGVLLPQEGGGPEERGQAQPPARCRKARSRDDRVDHPAQLREIAEAKMKDLSANDVEAAMQIILGSAKSMGIEVKG
jgi:large subunit ribosomal protein L11